MSLYSRLHELFEYKDGYLYRKISVQGSPKGKRVGIVGGNKYASMIVDGTRQNVHRMIYLFFNNYLPEQIDHIDGNKLNNCIENLRASTKSTNGFNRLVYKNNKSSVKNVVWKEKNKKWEVKLNVNNKRYHFGCFKDLELAELVAIEARIKFHGDYANHGYKEKLSCQ